MKNTTATLVFCATLPNVCIAQDQLSDLFDTVFKSPKEMALCHEQVREAAFDYFPCGHGMEVIYHQEFNLLSKSERYELMALSEGFFTTITHDDAFFKGDARVITSVSSTLKHELQRKLAADLGFQAAQMSQGVDMLRDGIGGFGGGVPSTLEGLVSNYQDAVRAASRTELPLVEARLMGARSGLRWLILTEDDADEAMSFIAGFDAFVEGL